MQAVRINGCNLFGGFFMAELIPYSCDYSFSTFYEKRICVLFFFIIPENSKTASLLLLFFHMKLLFSGKGLLGLFWSMSAPSGKQNVEKQGIMLRCVELYAINV